MKINKQHITLLVLIFLHANTYAQEVQSFSLKQCLEKAIKQNVSVVKAQLDEQEGKYKTKEVTATALPQINATGELVDNVLRQAFVFPASLGDPNAGPNDYIVLRGGLQYGTSINIQANQQLFNQSLFTFYFFLI